MDRFLGSRAILSGPAGGVVGYAMTSYQYRDHRDIPVDNAAVIGFDMGGTSTDVSRYSGTFDHVFESTTAGVTIQSPQLDIVNMITFITIYYIYPYYYMLITCN